MKFKSDFITNSSSTSFIIKARKTGTVLKNMWDHFQKNRKEYIKEEGYLIGEKEAGKWINENYKTFDDNVIIPWTCNYETFIYKTDWNKNIIIDTCNNENWYDAKKLDIIDNIVENYNNLSYEEIQNLEFLDLSDMKIKTKKEYFKQQNDRWKKLRSEEG